MNKHNTSVNKNIIASIVSHLYLTIFAVVVLAALGSVLGYFLNADGTLSSLDFALLAAIHTILVSLAVSLWTNYISKKLEQAEIDDRLGKYANVMDAAQLLQESRRNNGLAGIVDSPEEENIFEELSKSDYAEGFEPTVWWQNFRIEKYDTFRNSIEKLVRKGGKVYLITCHPDNPNIEFRLKEAYPSKSIDDYRSQFELQARVFAELENELKSSSRGEFKVYFNKESPSVPVFIVSRDLDYRAFSGFYLNDISGSLPYIVWETAAEGMVRRFRDYVDFRINNSVSAAEMLEELESRETRTW